MPDLSGVVVGSSNRAEQWQRYWAERAAAKQQASPLSERSVRQQDTATFVITARVVERKISPA